MEDGWSDDEVPSTDLKHFKVTSNAWIVTALFSAIIFSVGNMLVGEHAYQGFYARELTWFGNLFTSIFYMGFRIAYIKYTRGYYFKWNESPFRDIKTDGINWLAVWWQILDSVVYLFGGHLMILSFEHALYAGLNQGILTSLFSFTPILMAVAGFMIFREKLNIYHYSGITMMIVWIILMSFSNYTEKKVVIKVGNRYMLKDSPLWPIIFSILSCFYFMIRLTANKAMSIKFKWESYDFCGVTLFLSGFAMTFVVIARCATYGFYETVSHPEFYDWVLSGFLQGFGIIASIHAVSTGLSGPASAIINIQPIIQTILSTFFLSQYPNTIQIFAMIFAIFAVLVISIGKMTVKLVKSFLRIRSNEKS